MRVTVAQLRAWGFDGPIPEGRPTVLPAETPKRKAAHTRFTMNWTEERFARVLEGRRLCKEIKGWSFETYTFRLGPEMTFTPDFAVEENDGWMSFYDTKNAKHKWEDATIKIKTAAILYPYHHWNQATLRSGEWHIRTFRSEDQPR